MSKKNLASRDLAFRSNAARTFVETLECRTLLSAAASVAYLPADTLDVTSQVSIVRGGFRLDKATGVIAQTVTVTNISSKTIGQIPSLVLDNLPGAQLQSPDRTTSILDPLRNSTGELLAPNQAVSPFVTLYDVNGSGLLPGQSVSIQLTFDQAPAVTYNARVLIPNPGVSPLQFQVNDVPVIVGSLNPLDLGDQVSDAGPETLKITNVSNHPITLDGTLPSGGDNVFSYHSTSGNFRFGFTNFGQLTLENPSAIPIQHFSAFPGGLSFYNLNDTNFKILQPNESVEAQAFFGVTGLVAGIGSPIKGTSIPVLGFDGHSLAYILPLASGGRQVIHPASTRGGQRIVSAAVSLGNVTFGKPLQIKAVLVPGNAKSATKFTQPFGGGKVFGLTGLTTATALPKSGDTVNVNGYTVALDFPTTKLGAFTASFSATADDGFGHPVDYTLVFNGNVVAAKPATAKPFAVRRAVPGVSPTRPTAFLTSIPLAAKWLSGDPELLERTGTSLSW